MNSLFNLSARYQQVMDRISRLEEIDDETMLELETVSDSLEDKILNYTTIIKTMEAQAEAIDKAMASMIERGQKLINSASKLRDKVKNEMLNCNKDKIKNVYHEIQILINNPKVIIKDETMIPPTFIKTKTVEKKEPDKIAILKSYKDGKFIPGVEIIRDMRLEIR